MNYASIENIAKAYGERILFTDLSFGINQGQKIALIAKNGTGKTSLLNILSQAEQPDEGKVVFRKNIKTAFLPQEPNLDPKLTVEQIVFASDNEVLRIIEQYEKALKNPDDAEAYQKAFDLIGS